MVTIGQNIGNYKVTRQLGRGGCGEVFEAVYEKINRKAAIKVLHPEISQDTEMAQRFLNEARATNIVQHPGIVNVYEHGQLADGAAYIVMEYLEGTLLARRLEDISIEESLRIARQIAATLAAAHAKKIIHRDLKPENVMIVPDPEAPSGERVKLLDFGIAKVAQEYDGPGSVKLRTRTGATMGTPVYMSPEQCRGARGVTEKTDVYALGVMLYEMLSKELPFVARSPSEIMAKQIYEQPKPLKERNQAIPDSLMTLVSEMMAKDPEARPNMSAVSKRLAECASEMGRTIISYPSFDPVDGPRGRRAWLIGGGAAAALAVLLAALFFGPLRSKEKIHWTIDSTPSDAEVVLKREGTVLGRTPLKLERDRGKGSVEVLLRLKGHGELTLTLDQGSSVMVREALVAEAPPAEPAKGDKAEPAGKDDKAEPADKGDKAGPGDKGDKAEAGDKTDPGKAAPAAAGKPPQGPGAKPPRRPVAKKLGKKKT